MNWCSHIDIDKRGKEFGYEYSGMIFPMVHKWKLCPICSTPRPTKEKEEKVHELTKNCLDWHYSAGPVDPLDSIIRTWLEEKANKIIKHCCIEKVNFLSGGVYKILGLETEKVKTVGLEPNFVKTNNSNLCMSCGTIFKKETEKPLKERLMQKFCETHAMGNEHYAEVAIEFFKAESQKKRQK